VRIFTQFTRKGAKMSLRFDEPAFTIEVRDGKLWVNDEYDEEVEKQLLEAWEGDDDPRAHEGDERSFWADNCPERLEFLLELI
jgi:hypothetical protein